MFLVAIALRDRIRKLAHPAEREWVAVVVLLALCVFLFFYGLNAGELYRTEGLRAIIAAEFLRSGNWIVPTLYGEPLFTKPPGMYAAIALVSWPAGGVRDWTARLPSALAATATVFLVYWHFRRQVGRLGGLVAAVLLPTSFMWLDKSTAAEIDMLQVAWVTAAILCFLRALENEEDAAGRNCFPWWLAALLCVAGGVLTKWTAPAFFYGTAVPLLWWRGRLRLLLGRRHVVSAGLGALVCVAWIVAAVWMAGWSTFHETVSREALMRLSPGHHPRPYPWGETLAHPFVILAAALPCSVVALWSLHPSFAGLWDERGRRLLQALHCWTWPNLLFWSVIPEHAPRHSFPLFPGIAGLAAFVWIAWLTGCLPRPFAAAARRWRWLARVREGLSPAQLLLGILVAWLAVKVVFVEVVVPDRNHNREPKAKAAQIAAHVPRGQALYLFRLKDEGIMFYYGRPVLRLKDAGELPSSSEPVYCILEDAEWGQWDFSRPAQAVLRLSDEQGAPIVLVKVTG